MVGRSTKMVASHSFFYVLTDEGYSVKDFISSNVSALADMKHTVLCKMVGADFHFGMCPEDKVLSLLHDTTQSLQERLQTEGSRGAEWSGPELANEDSARVLKKLFWLIKEWSVSHIHRVGFLRGELNTTAYTLAEQERHSACRLSERDTQQASRMGVSWQCNLLKHASITDVVLNVLEDMQNVEQKLCSVTNKLDKAIIVLSKAKLDNLEANTEAKDNDIVVCTDTVSQDSPVHPQSSFEGPSVPQETCPEYASDISHLYTQECQALQSSPNTEAESYAVYDGKAGHQNPNQSFNESPVKLSRREDQEKEDIQFEVVKSSRNYDQGPHQAVDGEMKEGPAEEAGEKIVKAKDRDTHPAQSEGDCGSWTQSWATAGLTDSASSSSKVVCYITGPQDVTKVMTCKVMDGLSSLMVSGSEELVSSVLRIERPCRTKSPSPPLTIALPFRTTYRGNYREVTVKVVDHEHRVSYVTPAATEGTYGGHRGSFAVVRVYTLGVFAVVSRLQKETFTIPKRGLSVKLSVDSRICLDYLPGSFNTPVVAQAMVQPVDALLLSTLKCRKDSYHSILTTSPLLYLTHPSTLTPRRPSTITLPCPPNPDKRKTGEESSHTRPSSTALMPDTVSSHRIRVLSASVKSSRDFSKEQLAVLGWRDEQWNVLDKISRQDPSSAVLAVMPSRELSSGLAELQAQAYCGPPEPSAEFSMREGEQLLLKFSGNITSTGDQSTVPHTVTLHTQRRNWLYLNLKEQDLFGNYSSPHYKGTATVYRIPRDQLVWREDRAVISTDHSLQDPVCKLSLTLPKTVKTLSRPPSTKLLRHDQPELLCDELLAWLCGELSEEDAALLVMSLHLRRSTVQLARLRAPDSLSLQTFHILVTWRRALPSSMPKHPLLARCLTRIGRPELAAELLRRSPVVDEGDKRGGQPWRLITVERPGHFGLQQDSNNSAYYVFCEAGTVQRDRRDACAELLPQQPMSDVLGVNRLEFGNAGSQWEWRYACSLETDAGARVVVRVQWRGGRESTITTRRRG
ncbi:hypothetical protein NFI96_017872 [Prochilodus magdalenae]|nr:hypothetical protein NFI96_017872 [Prochilodus magdalenae]